MSAVLRCYRADGTLAGIMPDHDGLGVQEEHNGPGSFKCNYVRSGVNAGLIDGDAMFVAIADGGVERRERYLLEDDGEDPVAPGGAARLVEVGGRGVMALLEWALVYPRDYVPGGPTANFGTGNLLNKEPLHEFANATPGAIFSTLLAKAQTRATQDAVGNTGRDAIQLIDIDFDSTRDSAGQLWPITNYAVSYEAGLNLLAVLLAMADNAWADVRMDGFTLQMFVPDTVYGADRPDVILHAGREVLSGPRKRTRRAIRSHLLAIGDEGAIVERSAPTARSRYGRREGYEARSGITAVDTLTRVADAQLDGLKVASEGFTVECDLSAEGPQPNGSPGYTVGQRIRYDQRRLSPTALEPLRVRTIATAWDKNGNKTASVELNDLFVEAAVRLQRKVDGIVNGSSSNSRAPQSPRSDGVPPLAPAAVFINTGTVQNPDGNITAAATISWLAVTLNADGTIYDDAGNYFLSWGYVAANTVGTTYAVATWTADAAARTEVAYLDALTPGRWLRARVRTQDQDGNTSGYVMSSPVQILTDLTAPDVPSPPVLTPTLAALMAEWDGKTEAGIDMRQVWPDLSHVEVHTSLTSGFTPTPATLYDTLRTGPLISPIVDLPYDATTYVRFVAVDLTGNRSSPSAQSSGVPDRIGSGDLGDGSVTTVKIANLAVNDAQIGNVSASKITAGLILADLTISARIKTANTGNRVEIDALGIHGFSATAEMSTISASTGRATLTGATIRTGTVGARVEIDPSGIKGYSAAGTLLTTISAATGTIDAAGTISSGRSGPRAILDSDVFSNNPGVTFHTGKTKGYQPCIFNYATPPVPTASDDALWIISWETTINSSGRSEVRLHPNQWKIGHAYGGNTSYILGDRTDGNVAIATNNLYNFLFQLDGNLRMQGVLYGGIRQAGGNSTGAGMLNSGMNNQPVWFSYDGYFRIWVGSTNVCSITGDGRIL